MSDKVDNIDLGNEELDGGFDDFDFDEFDQKTSPELNNRQAAVEVGKSFGDGIASKVLSSSQKRKLILNALPSEYSAGYDMYSDFSDAGSNIYNEARNELLQVQRLLKQQVRTAIPALKTFLPSFVTDKLTSLTETNDYQYSYNATDPNEARLQTNMGEVFKEGTQTKEEYTADILKEQIQDIKEDKVNHIIANIGKDISILRADTQSVGTAYRRKMLEINYRQLFALEDTLALHRKAYAKLIPYNKKIVHNTALPDYAKEEMSEIISAKFKRGAIDAFGPSKFAQTFLPETEKKIIAAMKEFTGGLKDAISFGGQQLNTELEELTEEDFDEGDLSPRQRKIRAAKGIGGKAGEWVAEKYINPRLRKGASKIRERLDKIPQIKELGFDVEYLANNYAYIAQTMQDEGSMYSGKYKPVAKYLRELGDLLPSYSGEQLTARTLSHYDEDEPVPFRMRTDKSINVIIPGWLAKINQSIRSMATGREQPLETFDFKTNSFVSSEEVYNRIRESVNSRENKEFFIDQIDKIIDLSMGDKASELSDSERRAIGQHIDERIRKAKEFNLEDIANWSSFTSGWGGTDPEGSDKFESALRSQDNIKDLNNQVSKIMNTVRTELGYMKEEINDLAQTYGDEALVGAGVFKRDGDALVANKDIFNSYLDEPLAKREVSEQDLINRVLQDTGKIAASKFDAGGVNFRELIKDGVSDALYGGKVNDDLYKVLATISTSDKTDTEKKQSLKPIIEEIRDLIKEQNVKPTVETITDLVTEIAAKGITTYSFNSAEFAEEMDKRFKEWLPKLRVKDRSKAVWKFSQDKYRWAKDIISPKATYAKEYMSDKFNELNDWWNTEESYNKRRGFMHAMRNKVRGIWDIYDAEGNLFLKASKMKNGDYINEAGKVIKRITDIDGIVRDRANNNEVVWTKEEIQSKLDGLKYFRNGKWEAAFDLFSEKLRSGGNLLDQAVSTSMDFILKRAKSFYQKHRAQDVDIYVKGESSPRLRAIWLAKGLYVTASGKVIRDALDIDSAVYMGKKEIISEDELHSEGFELVDIDGNTLKSFSERILANMRGGLDTARALVMKPLDKFKDALGHVKDFGIGIKDTIADWIHDKRMDWGFEKAGTQEQTRRVARSARDIVKRLDDIYDLLDTRIGVVGTVPPTTDTAHNNDTKSNETTTAKSAVKEESFTGRVARGAKARADNVMGKVVGVRDAISDDLDTYLDERKQAKLYKNRSEQNAKAKAKAERKEERDEKWNKRKEALKSKFWNRPEYGDVDNDNIRDGSFRDIFAKRKAKKAAKSAVKDNTSDKKRSGFGWMISGLGLLLKPLTWLPAIAGFFLKGGLTKSILDGVGSLIKGGIGLAGKAALSLATRAAPAALSAGATALSWGGAAIGAVASAMSLPVVATIGTVAAVGYLAYKTATRKPVNPVDQVRYAQYGTSDYDNYSEDDMAKLRFLEDKMKGYVKINTATGEAEFARISNTDMAELISGLGIEADEKNESKLKETQSWLTMRFKTVYLTWATAINKHCPGKDVGSITEQVKDGKILASIIKDIKIPESDYMWKVTRGPLHQNILARGYRAATSWFNSDQGFLTTYEDVESVYEDALEYIKRKLKGQKLDAARKKRREYESANKSRDFKTESIKSTLEKETKPDQPKFGSREQMRTAFAKEFGSAINISETAMTKIVTKSGNKIDIAEKARLKAYGLKDDTLDVWRIEKLFALESKLISKTIVTNGSVSLSIPSELTLELGKDWSCNEFIFRNYLHHRFLPVFLSYITKVKLANPSSDPLNLDIEKNIKVLIEAVSGYYTVENDDEGRLIWSVVPNIFNDGTILNTDPTSLDGDLAKLNEIQKELKRTKAEVDGVSDTADSSQAKFLKALSDAKRHGEQHRKKLVESGSVNKNLYAGYNWTAEDAANDPFADEVLRNASRGYTDAPNYYTGKDYFGSMSEDANSAYAKLAKKMGAGTSKETMAELIKEVAKVTGVDADLLLPIAHIESSLDPNAKAKTSSATGLFQFIKSTWDEQLGKHADKYGVPRDANPRDPVANALMGAEFLRGNANQIKSALRGRTVNAADLYAAHFLGAGGARKFLTALNQNPGASGASVFPDAAAANKSIFYSKGRPRTLSGIYQIFQDKISRNRKATNQYVSNPKDIKDFVKEEQQRASSVAPAQEPSQVEREQAEQTKEKVQQEQSVAKVDELVGVNTAPSTPKPVAPTAPAGEQAYSNETTNLKHENFITDTKAKVKVQEEQAKQDQAMVNSTRAETRQRNEVTNALGNIHAKQLEVQGQILEVLVEIRNNQLNTTKTNDDPKPTDNKIKGNPLVTSQKDYQALINVGRR